MGNFHWGPISHDIVSIQWAALHCVYGLHIMEAYSSWGMTIVLYAALQSPLVLISLVNDYLPVMSLGCNKDLDNLTNFDKSFFRQLIIIL